MGHRHHCIELDSNAKSAPAITAKTYTHDTNMVSDLGLRPSRQGGETSPFNRASPDRIGNQVALTASVPANA